MRLSIHISFIQLKATRVTRVSQQVKADVARVLTRRLNVRQRCGDIVFNTLRFNIVSNLHHNHLCSNLCVLNALCERALLTHSCYF